MRFLITGGAGFIGSHTAELLLSQGHTVTVLDNLSTGKKENLAFDKKVEFIEGDVKDKAACERAAKGQDGVIHLAAQVSVIHSLENPAHTHQVNIDGTLNLLEASRKAGAKSFVFASSCAVYGDNNQLPLMETATLKPLSPYAVSKLAGENYCGMYRQSHGLKTCVFRFFNIFGSRQDDTSPYSGVIAIFAKRLLASQGVTLFGDGNQTRDFLYVKDLVKVLTLAGSHPESFTGPAYNLCSGKQTTVNQLFAHLSKAAGKSVSTQFAPARTGEILHSLGSYQLYGKVADSLGAPFQPTPLEEGLRETVRWYASR